jgi:membrane protein YqaA with SNARE-associated domain
MDPSTTLWSLFVSSFLAATLLPGGSELVLFGALKLHPQLAWTAVMVATAGNTLGALSSYAVGRVLPRGKSLKGLATVQRYGSPILLLSWVPIIGDALCVAAGWLRINIGLVSLFIAVGKFARYAVILVLSLYSQHEPRTKFAFDPVKAIKPFSYQGLFGIVGPTHTLQSPNLMKTRAPALDVES